jgi:hypothetical protein
LAISKPVALIAFAPDMDFLLWERMRGRSVPGSFRMMDRVLSYWKETVTRAWPDELCGPFELAV